MPTYDYKCGACGHTFDKFVPIAKRNIRKCPECGKFKVKQIVSGIGGAIFKGDGFYQNDYRSPAEEKKLVQSERQLM